MRTLLPTKPPRRLAAVLLAALAAGPNVARAFITTAGDVSPTYNGFSDPWFAGSPTIGGSGVGSVTVDGGSDVDTFDTYIGRFPTGDGSVTVQGFGSTWDSSGDVYVGDEGSGQLVVELGGAVTSDNGIVANAPSSVGTVTVRDAGSNWTLTDTLEVGVEGNAQLLVTDGGLVEAARVALGDLQGAQATATVHGTGSRLVSSGNLNVGVRSNATLNIQNQAVVDVAGDTLVGRTSGNPGELNFSGPSTLNTSGLFVAPSQLNGLGVINTTGIVSDVDLAFDATTGLQQQLTIDTQLGLGVTINVDATAGAPRDFGVGLLSSGTLSISDGLRLPSNRGTLGLDAGSVGTATVSGAGSGWDLNSFLAVGFVGEGALDIDGGASVTSFDGSIGAIAGSSGAVTVSGVGSLLDNSNFTEVGSRGTGELTVEAGARVNSGVGIVGGFAGGVGDATFTGAGTAWEIAGALAVGNEGSGSLTITDGARVEAGSLVLVGATSGGAGAIHFDGGELDSGGLAASPADLRGVGVINTATLLSDVDLVFDATNGPQQQLVLDDLPGQQVTIHLDLADPAALAGALGAGYRGTGSLRIADGLTIDSGFGSFGLLAGSMGVGTVTGAGTRWESGDLGVGDGGEGSLWIEEGAVVVSSLASVGGMSGAVGEATVSGAGSRWEVAGALEVADVGTGTLTIENGGFVSSASGVVGSRSGSVGNATVVGPGSTWETTGDLDVGSGGIGALSIADGALIKVGGEMEIQEFSGSFPSDVFITSGGQLALPGDADDSDLFRFLSFGIDVGLNFWDGAQWVNLSSGVEGVDYTLEEMTTGDLAGFTVLTVGTPVDLPGDYNGDGVVDAGDYVAYRDQIGQPTTLLNDVYGGDVDERRLAIWAANYGRSTSGQLGDFNGDGLVNALDYTAIRESGLGAAAYAMWVANYGAGSGPNSVPEPTAWVLAAAAGLFFGRRGGS